MFPIKKNRLSQKVLCSAPPPRYLLINDITDEEFKKVGSYLFVFNGNETDSLMSLNYNSYRKPLEIQTKSKRLIFKNISFDYEDTQQNYFNFGFSNKLNKHLVYATYYEMDEFLLIDNNTAHVDTLNGRPYISPNLKKIFSFNINPYTEIQINNTFVTVSDIQLHIYSNGKREGVLQKQVNFIPLEIKWRDTNSILIKAINSLEYENYKGAFSNVKNYVYKQITIGY